MSKTFLNKPVFRTSLDETLRGDTDPAALSGHADHPPRMGFFSDTSVCIGCKACEVACKEWNNVPEDGIALTGMSYDNTGQLGANSWRHVAFIEQVKDRAGARATTMQPFQSNWLMASDVCKHCVNAGCMQACPTGAIIRTEFDSVVIQQDI